MVEGEKSFQYRTSSSLLDLVRQEDRLAWNKLVQLYGPLIFRWSLRCGLREHDAEDVMQNVFAALARNLDQFENDGRPSSFRRWLKTVTGNQVRDFIRRRHGAPDPEGGTEAYLRVQDIAAEPPLSDEDADDADSMVLLRRALELVGPTASEQSLRIFLAVKVEGRGVSEVAQTYGITVSGVYKAVDRVLKLLRAEYPDCLENDAP